MLGNNLSLEVEYFFVPPGERQPTSAEHAAFLRQRLAQLELEEPNPKKRAILKANFEKLIEEVEAGRQPKLKYLLSPGVLAKASLKGLEYAWNPSDVETAINDARLQGLETIGDQAQFRFSDCTCELYWIDIGPSKRHLNESWSKWVERSADETITKFRQVMANTDWDAEIQNWTFLREKAAAGVDVKAPLCFVLYFGADPLARSSES